MACDPDFEVQLHPPDCQVELLPPDSHRSCDGCSYPHPPTLEGKPKWTTRRANLGAIALNAEGGCLICSLLREGIERVMADNEGMKAEHIVMHIINSRKMKAVRLHIFGTPIDISFYVSES
jgi:hypothetical protein